MSPLLTGLLVRRSGVAPLWRGRSTRPAGPRASSRGPEAGSNLWQRLHALSGSASTTRAPRVWRLVLQMRGFIGSLPFPAARRRGSLKEPLPTDPVHESGKAVPLCSGAIRTLYPRACKGRESWATDRPCSSSTTPGESG